MPRLIRSPNAAATIALLVLGVTSSACDPVKFVTANYDPCSGGPAVVASVKVQPLELGLRVGDVAQLLATREFSKGDILCDPGILWTSANPAVVQVSYTSANLGGSSARAVTAGTTSISVTSGGKSAVVNVTVTTAPLASLAIEPQQLALRVGQSIRLSASARDSAGNKMTVRTIVWSSENQAVATVSSTGLLTAVESGTASVRATVEKVTVLARIPVTRDAPAVRVQQISAGYSHTCAIASGEGVPEGSAYCWGKGAAGRLGNGEVVQTGEPTRVAGTQVFTSIAAGLDHTCAIARDTATYCWGSNHVGQLGDGTLVARSSPVRVVTTLAFRFVALVGSTSTSCGLVADGAAYCWGNVLAGAVVRTPTPLPGGLRFAEIDGGWAFMCGRTLSKQVYCWGGYPFDRNTPTLTSGSILFEQFDAGLSHVCGVASTGGSYCWGSLGGSVLGSSVAQHVTQVPRLLETTVRFSALNPAGSFTCGISDSGAYCLGNSWLSGADSSDPAPHPIPDERRHPFVKISGGSSHACAIDTTGGSWCWGRNYEGQIGSGESSLVPPTTPRQVLIR